MAHERHPDSSRASGRGEAHRTDGEARPTAPSSSVAVDVGEHTGALVLMSSSEREGLEVEIHLESDPGNRTHVWVLPRVGPHDGTVYAAVFPSLTPGTYSVLQPDGRFGSNVRVDANCVTTGAWIDDSGHPGVAGLQQEVERR